MSGVVVRVTYRALDRNGHVWFMGTDLDAVIAQARGSRGPFTFEVREVTEIDEGWTVIEV